MRIALRNRHRRITYSVHSHKFVDWHYLSPMKIVFTGGGTGGHIFPIVQIIREFKEVAKEQEKKLAGLNAKIAFYYLGPKDEFGSALLLKEGVNVNFILGGKVRRYFSPEALLQNVFDLVFLLPVGFLQSFFKMFFLAPEAVFSKGGYGSLPVILAAWILDIPVFVHESDKVAGRANRLAAKFAKEIFTAFADTEGLRPDKQIVVGHPVRKALLHGSKDKAREIFSLTLEKPVVLLMGGSQGASRINDLVINILAEWLGHFELLHLTGKNNYQDIKNEAEVILPQELKKYYHPVGFLEEAELAHAYQAADLIVSRGGSGSIFEIAALGKPSVLIPLPEAAQNAYAYKESGATLVIEQANLTPHFLLEEIRYIFSHPEQYRKMAESARRFAKPRAARIIAEYLFVFLFSA